MEFETANATDQSSNLEFVEKPLHGYIESTLENYYENFSDDGTNKETYLLLPNDHHKEGCDEFGAKNDDNFLTSNNCVSIKFLSTEDIEGEISYYPSCSSDEEDNKEKSLSDKLVK